LLSAIFIGLALSSKWATIYLFGLYFLLLIRYRLFSKIIYFLILPPIIYLISYSPFFILGHSFDQFIGLQKQMWWYHTGLKATHDYSSPWWSWPLNLYPIWYFVDYKGKDMANIFASGNPIVFWSGLLAIILTLREIFKEYFDKAKKRTDEFEGKLVVLLGYLIFFVPWALSPRIMFLYHYSPSVPFMCLLLGYQLSFLNIPRYKHLLIAILILTIEAFILIYPFLTAIHLPKESVKLFFLTNITKDPF
jgi:dolichyl-phosphate-mannose--protein O-mannosyl transferase